MRWSNRFTVLGSTRQLQLFRKSRWAHALGARYCELIENSRRRFACRFETVEQPIERLRKLSRRWPELKFLIDYEEERQRVKGLAVAEAGYVVSCHLQY